MLSESVPDAPDQMPGPESGFAPLFIPVGRESRKFRRYYFRGHATATIYPPAGSEHEKPQVCFVLTRDLSRNGIGIVHPVSLLENQRMDLEFPTGQKLSVQVQRIKHLEQGCFLFGCRILGREGDTKSG
jgi:hypothetical protein